MHQPEGAPSGRRGTWAEGAAEAAAARREGEGAGPAAATHSLRSDTFCLCCLDARTAFLVTSAPVVGTSVACAARGQWLEQVLRARPAVSGCMARRGAARGAIQLVHAHQDQVYRGPAAIGIGELSRAAKSWRDTSAGARACAAGGGDCDQRQTGLGDLLASPDHLRGAQHEKHPASHCADKSGGRRPL